MGKRLEFKIPKDADRRRPLREGEQPSVIILPVIPIVRADPKKPRPRRARNAYGDAASRRMLNQLWDDAATFENCMRWIQASAEHGHDVRAIVEFIEPFCDDFSVFRSAQDVDELLIYITRVLTEWRKRFAPSALPKT